MQTAIATVCPSSALNENVRTKSVEIFENDLLCSMGPPAGHGYQ
jgi:hypothetical protein